MDWSNFPGEPHLGFLMRVTIGCFFQLRLRPIVTLCTVFRRARLPVKVITELSYINHPSTYLSSVCLNLQLPKTDPGLGLAVRHSLCIALACGTKLIVLATGWRRHLGSVSYRDTLCARLSGISWPGDSRTSCEMSLNTVRGHEG